MEYGATLWNPYLKEDFDMVSQSPNVFGFICLNVTKASVGRAGTNPSTTLYIKMRRRLCRRSSSVSSSTSSFLIFVIHPLDKFEKIQNWAIRFIKRDYRSRERGCITKMRKELVELETLEERRQSLRLILMYKVVEGTDIELFYYLGCLSTLSC
jgi:hypothetical protein